MTRRLRITDLLPPPSSAVAIAAVVAGAVFASVGFTVDQGVTFSRQSVVTEEPEALRQKHRRTEALLKAIEREVSADRSSAPVTIRTPRVAVAPRPRPRVRYGGIWSEAKEQERAAWRRWADAEITRRQE